MKRNLRAVPFPWGSQAWRDEFRRLCNLGHLPWVARWLIRGINEAWRFAPSKGEKCGAYARSTGKPCQAPAGMNGRCKLHGSGGPKTTEGRTKALLNLRQFRKT